MAIGGLFGPKLSDTDPYICIDCGYIVKTGFASLPKQYECPKCGVGKNRFKKYQAAGSSYAAMAAEKKANRAALKKKSGEMTARQKLKMQQMQMQEDKDTKKKGWFGR